MLPELILGARGRGPELGSSTLKVLNYKYNYFPLSKYLSTSAFNFVHSKYIQNVLKYN